MQSTPLWISAGSLIVSAIALWRSGRIRVLDMRTAIRRDIAELEAQLKPLRQKIYKATELRKLDATLTNRASAPPSMLQAAMEADLRELDGLLEKLNVISQIPLLTGYGTIERKVVALSESRVKAVQIMNKYAKAS